MTISMTDHALKRLKERAGLNKKAATRTSSIAYEKGIRHGETKGQLFEYIAGECARYMRKGTDIRIYGDMVYCFRKENRSGERVAVLLTAFHIPNSLQNQIHSLQRKKRGC